MSLPETLGDVRFRNVWTDEKTPTGIRSSMAKQCIDCGMLFYSFDEIKKHQCQPIGKERAEINDGMEAPSRTHQ